MPLVLTVPMNHRLNGPLSWLLSPAALYLGLQVRSRTQRLPPPPGRQSGQAGPGREAGYRLLVVGDSSAAGVGTDQVDESLGPQLAAILNARTGETVRWRIASANSAISEQVRDYVVPNLEPHAYSHIVVCIGMNDMKNFLTVRRFKKGFGGLLYALHARWPDASIVWTPLLDMRTVPSLPPLLGYVLELRASMLNRVGAQLCRERHAIVSQRLDSRNPKGFSPDGFHASPAGYHYWAGILADTIIGPGDDRDTEPQTAGGKPEGTGAVTTEAPPQARSE